MSEHVFIHHAHTHTCKSKCTYSFFSCKYMHGDLFLYMHIFFAVVVDLHIDISAGCTGTYTHMHTHVCNIYIYIYMHDLCVCLCATSRRLGAVVPKVRGAWSVASAFVLGPISHLCSVSLCAESSAEEQLPGKFAHFRRDVWCRGPTNSRFGEGSRGL